MKIQEPVSSEQAHNKAVAVQLENRCEYQFRLMEFGALLGCVVGTLAFLGLFATWFAQH